MVDKYFVNVYPRDDHLSFYIMIELDEVIEMMKYSSGHDEGGSITRISYREHERASTEISAPFHHNQVM